MLPPKQSLLGFLVKHPYAFGGSILIHLLIGVSLWLGDYDADTPTHLLSRYVEQAEIENGGKVDEQKTEETIIQAEAVSAQDVEKQIQLLKEKRQRKRRAEQRRLANISKKQAELNQTKKVIAREHKKLAETREREEKRIAQLKKQKDVLDQQKTELIKKTATESKRLAEQKKESEKLQKNLSAIRREEEKIAQQLTALNQKTEIVRKVNQEAIEEALRQQKMLEEKRTQEELKIEQAKQKQEQLELQKKQAQERLKKLTSNQESTAKKLLASERKKQEIDEANQKQLTVLKKQYINSIRVKVKDNWRRLPKFKADWICEVLVSQSIGGKVKDVTLKNCSKEASDRFKDSVKKAVYRADPLPSPPHMKVFDQDITFIFKP